MRTPLLGERHIRNIQLLVARSRTPNPKMSLSLVAHATVMRSAPTRGADFFGVVPLVRILLSKEDPKSSKCPYACPASSTLYLFRGSGRLYGEYGGITGYIGISRDV